MDYVMRGSYN